MGGGGKRMDDSVEPDSEIKLVPVSGALPELDFLGFWQLGFWLWLT